MIQYTTATTQIDIQQILDLQKINLPANISQKEAKEQGFVTVHHDFELLAAMNEKFPHIIAKEQGQVIGYTLVMLADFGNRIPVLRSLFEKINALTYNGEQLSTSRYFVMGQVCVDKNYRGKGIFSGLYQKMKAEMSPYFEYIITEIATRNTRSIKAHKKVGFEVIEIFQAPEEEWAIVAWNWD